MQNNTPPIAAPLPKTKSGRVCWRALDTQKRLAHWSATGLSAADIAALLQCTRDQVAGAMRRYGLFAAWRG